MYIVSHEISEELKPLWFEEVAYKKENLHSIKPNTLPPVNYDSHIINSHSITHIETPKHTQKDGHSIDWYFNNSIEHFYGEVLVIKLLGDKYIKIDDKSDIYHWEISLEELKLALKGSTPKKLLITTKDYPGVDGFHDPKYVLTLTQEAADFLIANRWV